MDYEKRYEKDYMDKELKGNSYKGELFVCMLLPCSLQLLFFFTIFLFSMKQSKCQISYCPYQN